MLPSSASMIHWVRSRPDDAVKVMDIDRLFAAGAPRAVLAGRLRYRDGYAFTLIPERLGIVDCQYANLPHDAAMAVCPGPNEGVRKQPARITRVKAEGASDHLQVMVNGVQVCRVASGVAPLILEGEAWCHAYGGLIRTETENGGLVWSPCIDLLDVYALPTFCSDEGRDEMQIESMAIPPFQHKYTWDMGDGVLEDTVQL